MEITPEIAAWTRDALERLFDLSFLGEHTRAPFISERFATGGMLQAALLEAIKQLSPPDQVPAQSLARRIHTVLQLRYVQGLTQSEAAAEMNVGLRHLRREQDRAVRAAATLLFERPAQMESERAAQQNTAARAAPPEQDQQEAVALDVLLRRSLHVFEPLLQQHDIHVNMVLPSPLPVAAASPMVVRQLLVSALTWMLQNLSGSVCEIRFTVEADWLHMHFAKPVLAGMGTGADTDPSLGRDELATIATITQLASMASGEVACRSAAGSMQVIDIRLPAKVRKVVLMVDDNLDAIRLARRYLEQSDEFELVAISDPAEAMQHARTIRPVCILLDVMMPKHDGWEILSILKTHPETASVPIVITSILNDHGLARALGAASFLHRPFSALQLIAVLRSAIAHSNPPQAQSPA